jgi:hypothetical protein
MYLDAEREDGYIRDGCVFDPVIDICDRMASLEEAVQAVMVGVAANPSIATGRTVDVQRLLRGASR